MVRLMREADREIYFEMSRQFYLSGAAKGTISDEMRLSFWKEIMLSQSVKGYIIENENKIAGYALCVYYCSQEFGGKVLWIDELFVKSEFRGKGLGRQFLNFAEKIENVVLMRLEAEPDNEKAIALYKSLGYENLKYLQLIKRIK